MSAAFALALLLAGPAQPPSVKWEKSFDGALKKARKAGKPVLVDFWADWCGWCHLLDSTTYADPVVARKAEAFVAVKVNTEGGQKGAEIALRYEVHSLPTILFLSPEGRQVGRLNAFQGPGQFPRTLDAALTTAERVMEWEQAIRDNPQDPGALAGLGQHLFEQERYEEGRELLYRAVENDAAEPIPDRRRTRMMLAIIENYAAIRKGLPGQEANRRFAEAESLLKQALALKPGGEDEPKLLFVLGRTYVSWGRHADGVETLQFIVREYPQSPLAQKARETLVNLGRR